MPDKTLSRKRCTRRGGKLFEGASKLILCNEQQTSHCDPNAVFLGERSPAVAVITRTSNLGLYLSLRWNKAYKLAVLK